MPLTSYGQDALAVNQESRLALQPAMAVPSIRSMRRGRSPRVPFELRPAWSQRLVQAREARGLSQDALSSLVGIAQTRLASYETGGNEPDLAVLAGLASHLGCDPGWLAFGDPTQEDAPLGAIIERYRKDELFIEVFLRTAAMLGQEGFEADLHYVVRVALRLAEQVRGGDLVLTTRERIDQAMTAERLHRREMWASLNKGRG